MGGRRRTAEVAAVEEGEAVDGADDDDDDDDDDAVGEGGWRLAAVAGGRRTPFRPIQGSMSGQETINSGVWGLEAAVLHPSSSSPILAVSCNCAASDVRYVARSIARLTEFSVLVGYETAGQLGVSGEIGVQV
jgi:hypothetical protein